MNRPRSRLMHRLTIATTTGLLLCGCKPADQSAGPTAARSGPPTVYTTFYPTTYFAERIGGAHVRVVCPCPADADPAYWMPDDSAVAAYQQADLIVINGAEFEKWLARVTLPESRMVNTASGIKDEWIVLEEAVTHSHGPAGAHAHSGIDGHTWVDPVNAKAQAQQIADAFARVWPAHAETFKANMAALAADLDKVDARLRQVGEKLGKRTLLCAHPAYNYLARRQGWTVKSFHLDPAETPPADEWAAIAKACAESQPAAMLWEAEPLEETRTLLRERCGLPSVVFSPAEALDDTERAAGVDFLSIMHANADRLLAALAGSGQ